jgi:hypothetical protein
MLTSRWGPRSNSSRCGDRPIVPPEDFVTTATAASLTFEVEFRDISELRHVYERELLHSGYFLRDGEALREREHCRLILHHPAGGRLELEAEVVWLSPEGVGLQLLHFDEDLKQRLHDFVDDVRPVARVAHQANPYLRLRSLPLAEQLRRARSGELQDRVALERLYGKSVWETLLTNPRLTVAEVSRLARKGTLPLPLVDLIAGNEGWISNPEVRRSLLSNPRLRGRSLERILSVIPRAELKLIEQQTAYPSHVREAARRRVKS